MLKRQALDFVILARIYDGKGEGDFFDTMESRCDEDILVSWDDQDLIFNGIHF